ncbi:MAG TPA: ADP-ribosylation factor-like protein [Candidatus Deferrimicrobium sp.]|nr:ADP-ribosylation factor-like protein [Candidatus Deferrimicrobium sp.]
MSAEKRIKMAIVGLDNAGKSTILLTLQRQAGLQDFTKLQPTKGLQTEQFTTDDNVYNVWDFGGQSKYRESYLQKPEYFAETDKVIFVIDIQDKERFEVALKYLEEILEIMKKNGIKCEYSIFLHKFDPELLESEEYQERSQNLRKKLRQLFKNYQFQVKVFHTSIYTIFQRIQVM